MRPTHDGARNPASLPVRVEMFFRLSAGAQRHVGGLPLQCMNPVVDRKRDVIVTNALGNIGILGILTVRPTRHDVPMTTSQGALFGIGSNTPTDAGAAAVEAFTSAFTDAFSPCVDTVEVDAQFLDAMLPGPAMATLLAATDVTLLTPAAQLAYAASTERLAAWVQSVQHAALVAYAGATPRISHYDIEGRGGELVDERRSHLARRLLWSETMAHQRLTVARVLHTSLPRCAEALACGAISGLRAAALADAARTLTTRVDALLEVTPVCQPRDALTGARSRILEHFESKAVPYAIGHDLSGTRSKCRGVVAAIDPDGLAWRRAIAARDLTAVSIRHEDDCMSTLRATMPSELAIECLQAIDSAADDASRIDPHLPVGVRRAQAMHGLLTGGGCADSAEAIPGRRVTRLNVTIDLATLLGLRERPADLNGVGPLPATAIRELIRHTDEASIRWLITDHTERVVDTSPRRYRLSSALRELVISRDGVCAEPHCSAAADRCEIDHIQPFDSGGPTTPENLQPLCKRHHQLKTHGGGVPGSPWSSGHTASASGAASGSCSEETTPASYELAAAATDLVNRAFRARQRAIEYGQRTAEHDAAVLDARITSFARRAAHGARLARQVATHGCLQVVLEHSFGLYRRQQGEVRDAPRSTVGNADHPIDDPPPF